MTTGGRVSIVGAGPGDPELITLRGLRRVRQADVLIYDRLVHPGLVAETPPHAERVFAGKSRGFSALDQRAIERLMIDRARAGQQVVRLKGGDPFVFGRGGEEMEALVAAGIPTEFVPGLTSAIAIPGCAGIPVTHRALASSITIITGHDPNGPLHGVDWSWAAANEGTLIILMGLCHLDLICRRLVTAGRSPRTPAAVISRGTWPDEEVVTAPLINLAEAAGEAGLESPSLIVVGDVVALRDDFAVSLMRSGAHSVPSERAPDISLAASLARQAS